MTSEAPTIERAGNRWAFPKPPRHTSTLLIPRREGAERAGNLRPPDWRSPKAYLKVRRGGRREEVAKIRCDLRPQQRVS
jgi:hypothetical protein